MQSSPSFFVIRRGRRRWKDKHTPSLPINWLVGPILSGRCLPFFVLSILFFSRLCSEASPVCLFRIDFTSLPIRAGLLFLWHSLPLACLLCPTLVYVAWGALDSVPFTENREDGQNENWWMHRQDDAVYLSTLIQSSQLILPVPSPQSTWSAQRSSHFLVLLTATFCALFLLLASLRFEFILCLAICALLSDIVSRCVFPCPRLALSFPVLPHPMLHSCSFATVCLFNWHCRLWVKFN